MSEISDLLGRHRLIPVISIDRVSDARPLAEALIAGGLPVAEVTFRTPVAGSAIEAMARRSDILVGAGTVLNVETARHAIDAGARFIVSPGFSETVVSFCLKHKVPVIPGCVTPTEMMLALEHGIDTVKFFPAEAAGGVAMLKALAAPFPNLRFIPTGGISENNLADYLSIKPVLACGGSWMVSRELLDRGAFDQITQLTAKAVAMTV